MSLSVEPVAGLPEFVAGDDLPAMLADAVAASLEAGDIVVVTSKIVSKAEGRQVAAADREDAITSQTVRLVAQRGATRIVENPQGLVMAAAGVDASNAPDGVVLLLPEDPDASALAIARALRERTGLEIGVIVSDTFGRPWRDGQVDAAIGAAGIHVIEDLRGRLDANGRELQVSAPAVADEIAAAAELVKGKSSGVPVAIVRGLGHLVGGLDLPGARRLVRLGAADMFRVGSEEAWREGYEAGLRGATTE
ncbi:MAG TPA: coenzyme F420-0:L-glutamate ligase [Pseudolysinimonas sp.]|nr:coenzyme F420-0:L-glutamate ligase [Pseudolysinimonas sp.]